MKKAKNGPTSRNGSEKEKRREIKVGCWYGVEAVPKSQQRRHQRMKTEFGQQALRTRDMSYYCEIEIAEMFGDLFWASGCQRQADPAAEVVFVCDGAHKNWRLIELYYPQATQFVDWFHAEERLEKVAQEALSWESAQEWLERVRTCSWESDPSFVIRACQKLAAHSQEAGQAATCFSNKAERMAYVLYRRPGYMIGSGPVESGCIQIVTQGLKRAGAQWLVAGANQTA